MRFEIAPPTDLAEEKLFYLADIAWTGWKSYPIWSFMISNGVGVNQMRKLLLLDNRGKIVGDASYALSLPTFGGGDPERTRNIGNEDLRRLPAERAAGLSSRFLPVTIIPFRAGETSLPAGQVTDVPTGLYDTSGGSYPGHQPMYSRPRYRRRHMQSR